MSPDLVPAAGIIRGVILGGLLWWAVWRWLA